MSISITSNVNLRSAPPGLVALCAGAGAYLFFLSAGEILLRDSDSLWQIKIGQSILDHGAMPYTDVYSFTRFGEPWLSRSWLSQVLLATVHGAFDWAGPVILTSLAIGVTVGIFIYLLDPYLDPARSILLVTLALLMSGTHFLARPHMLALPVMLAFVGGLMVAADHRSHPSWLLLPLMVLWANLHGGFVLGLGLIWMALTHSRNIEVFAFLAPLVLAKPIAEQWRTAEAGVRPFGEIQPPYHITIIAALAIAAAGWASTKTFVAHHPFSFVTAQTPVAAADVLEQRRAQRIFSTAPIGGDLISRDIKVFIDGRAEVYGEKFVMVYFV